MAELGPEQRRVLLFLARGQRTVIEIAAQGITGEMLSGLVKAGFARKLMKTVGRGPDAVDITRGWEITPAGRQALREA